MERACCLFCRRRDTAETKHCVSSRSYCRAAVLLLLGTQSPSPNSSARVTTSANASNIAPCFQWKELGKYVLILCNVKRTCFLFYHFHIKHLVHDATWICRIETCNITHAYFFCGIHR